MAKNVDGIVQAEGEFTLYDRFWSRLSDIFTVSALEWYIIRKYGLETARNNEKISGFPAEGNILIPITLDGTAQIRFETPTAHSFELSEYQPLKLKFTELHLTNTAQAGKTLKLLIGKGDWELIKKTIQPVDIQAQLRSEVANTNTLLTANEVYTSDSFDALNCSGITVIVFADQASATDGLQIQESIDNTNWEDATEESVSASTLKRITSDINARYVRIKYTNGATDQGTFRLMALARVI